MFHWLCTIVKFNLDFPNLYLQDSTVRKCSTLSFLSDNDTTNGICSSNCYCDDYTGKTKSNQLNPKVMFYICQVQQHSIQVNIFEKKIYHKNVCILHTDDLRLIYVSFLFST